MQEVKIGKRNKSTTRVITDGSVYLLVPRAGQNSEFLFHRKFGRFEMPFLCDSEQKAKISKFPVKQN